MLSDAVGRVKHVSGRWIVPLMRHDPLPCRPLVAVALALGLGCGASRWLGAACGASTAAAGWAAAVAAGGAWGWLLSRGRERLAAWPLLAAVCLAGVAWGTARFDLFSAQDVAWQFQAGPAPVVVRGTVLESPRLLPSAGGRGGPQAVGPSSEFLIAIDEIRVGSRWRPASGGATVVVGGAPAALVVGSRVRVLGRGLRPAAAANPGEFDFGVRARSERRLSILRVDSWKGVRLLAGPPWWSIAAPMDRVRIWAGTTLASHLAPTRVPLASALLLGARESLPRADADDFVATGTIHVLAISGLHVGLVAAGLFGLLRGLLVPHRWASLVVAIVTGLYMLLVGAETPVVRATLLVWVACGAVGLSRRVATINSLALAAIVLLIWRPAEVFSAGAQLSFLSTGVLVGVARALPRRQVTDPIERLIERSRSPAEKWLRSSGWWLATLAISGAAVWLAGAPLVASRFHMFSPIGLIVNVVIAPLVPLAMACGFVCLLSAVVSPLVAGWFGAGCDAALAAVDAAVSVAAAVPGGHTWVAGPALWWVVGWYGLLAAACLWLRRDLLGRPTTWAVLAGAWAVVGLVSQSVASPTPGLRVVVAAVGHGCGIVVRSPLGRCLVYDAGRLGAPAAARRAMAAVLWSEGIQRVDTLVVSHADADHFNAVAELLERFDVGRILVPESFLASSSLAVADLLNAAAVQGVPVQTAEAGHSFAIDSLCRGRVLHPPPGAGSEARIGRADNESSLVLSVEAAGRRLLLTGDLEGDALRRFVASAPGACDVLVAPHHGSHTSLPADIAAATRPQYIVASWRRGRRWPEVQQAYAAAAGGVGEVLITGQAGALAVSLTAERVVVERYADGGWQQLEPPPVPLQPSPRILPDEDQRATLLGDLVSSEPMASSSNWLATYPPRRSSTPLVNP